MAASFYSSPLIGATTTLACFAHEIPHEIADYSILVRSGFTKRQAMQSQFVTAVGAFVRINFTCLSVLFSHFMYPISWTRSDILCPVAFEIHSPLSPSLLPLCHDVLTHF